jgi:lipopolysaccharide export system protein LptC
MNVATLTAWIMPVRRSWDRLSIYAPLILLAVLALVSYWLVRSSPALLAPEEDVAQKHIADYFMQNFSVRVYDAQGKLKHEIKGIEGKHFPDTDTVEVIQPRVKAYGTRGELTTATADKGIINGDGTQVQLLENAVIVRDPKRENEVSEQLKSDFFDLYTDTETIRTHLPVEIIRGQTDHFTADSMVYDNLARTMQLQGRVKGLMTPSKKKAS